MSVVKEWAGFLFRRVSHLLMALFLVSLITFIATHLIGNPVYLLIGQSISHEMIEQKIKELGLDRPLWEQYLTYVANLLRGDWGVSRYTFNPVIMDIGRRLPATLELSTFALLLAVIWAVPMGIVAAVKKNSSIDVAIQTVNRIGVCMPNFWLGLILIYFLFARLRICPAPLGRLAAGVSEPPHVTGWFTVDSILAGDGEAFLSSLKQLVLPVLTLAMTVSPSILQLTRNVMDNVLKSGYMQTAKAYGLPRLVYLRYALKSVLVPVLTVIAMTYGYLLSSTVLVEVVFSWPGIGFYAVDAMNHSDYEPILGVVVICTVFYFVFYLVSDILSALVDPRFRMH